MEQLRGRGNCIGVVFLKVRFLFTASFHTFFRNFVYLSVAKYSLFNILSNRPRDVREEKKRKEKERKRETLGEISQSRPTYEWPKIHPRNRVLGSWTTTSSPSTSIQNPFDPRWRGSGPLMLGAEFGAREKSVPRTGRGGRRGDRDGYAPGKRWSPSTVGRKRKYWDWLSRTRDRGPTLGTLRECAHDAAPSLLLLHLLVEPPPPASLSSFPTARWGQIPPWRAANHVALYISVHLRRRFLAYRFLRGFKDSRSEQWGIPFGLANNTGSAPTSPLPQLPSLPSNPRPLRAITARSFFLALLFRRCDSSCFVTPKLRPSPFRYKSNLT